MSVDEMSKIEFYFTSEQKQLLKVIEVTSSQLHCSEGKIQAQKVKTFGQITRLASGTAKIRTQGYWPFQ